MCQRDYLHKKAIADSSGSDYNVFKVSKNKVNYEVRKAKRMFYANSFASIILSSDIWKTVKTILPTKTNNTQSELSATDFNTYFHRGANNQIFKYD